MRNKSIFYDKDFQSARLIFYFILLISFIYFAYFSNLKCRGCVLCGMTRAVKCLLSFNIKKAFEYNNMVWIFLIIIPIITIDIICILKTKYKNK